MHFFERDFIFFRRNAILKKVIDPKEDIRNCKKIGQEVIDRLDWKPGELFITREIRNKYSCPVADTPTEVRSSNGIIAQKISFKLLLEKKRATSAMS
jgi:hypothetical protein